VQASGGIARLADLRDLKDLGIGAAVIGKALYEGRFTLTEALAC
jgi:phosphoribosylformimino-5-aminoimidazole carboxamide ribotide isomerase